MTESGRTALVVVNYASAELIEENYGDLELESVGAELVLVDNRKTLRDTEAMRELALRQGWRLIENDENLGFGIASNQGVDAAIAAGADVAILANPDLRLTLPVIRDLADAVRADPSTALSPTVLEEEGRVWFAGGLVLLDEGRTTTRAGSDSAQPGGWLAGTCVAISASLWRKAGGFSSEYFLYWEDVDLSWRITEAGGFLLVRDDLQVVHAVGATQGGGGKSPTYIRYNCRNRLIFAARHLDPERQRVWARRSFHYAKVMILRSGRERFVRQAVPIVWAAVEGTASGLRELRRSARATAR
jgi:N-acetylglucosaminyl-diphospho-decaprenol L-rhamnosyltransferase